MELRGKYLAIWLQDAGARLFLGLPPKSTIDSRWVVWGMAAEGGESMHGVWVEIDAIQERDPEAKVIKEWTVQPPIILVRWDWIISVQIAGREVKDAAQFGFRPI